MDYFGRTAGTGPRDADFPFMDHIAQTDSTGITADTAASVALLREHADDVYAVGFCFGGTMAWSAATHGHGLAGVVGFYGKPDADRPAGDGPIWDRAHLFECPVLSLFGGADPSIPQANIDRFDAALAEAGVDFETVVYPGAPHSFFDRTQAEFAKESLDAWNRIVGFMSS
ncbi:MAG: dienelactone hydrolase family protein, partial [Acidimicrobiia bacterium]|nr:dienelactone hydrolase family protein [Acidimicrobiia bacterium]